MPESLLSAANLFCERDRRVLFDDLSLSVNAGEVLQIEGANGSGKTTLLRILAGLSDAYEGDVSWLDQPIAAVRADYHANLNYLGHLPGAKAALTAQENLHWYAALAGLSLGDEIMVALHQVGLRGFEDVPCATLSAGQQRRVNLARLYLVPAKLWILDEPFTAIDKTGVVAIESLISTQVANGGAVIVTTHQSLRNVSNVRGIELG